MRERILIVEDDPAISKLIDTNLALSGYQTVCAMDGKQAVLQQYGEGRDESEDAAVSDGPFGHYGHLGHLHASRA